MIKEIVRGLIEITRGDASVLVYEGEIVSYKKRGIEYWHGGGKPLDVKELPRTPEDFKGWQKSEIAIWPVFGSVKDNRVVVNKGDKQVICPMDRHGVSRHLDWEYQSDKPGDNDSDSFDSITYKQFHDGERPINRTGLTPLTWPFESSLEKEIILTANGGLILNFGVTNDSEYDMPSVFGWHPALNALGPVKDGCFLKENGDIVSLETLVQSKIIPVPNTNIVGYRLRSEPPRKGLSVKSRGFKHAALWTPDKDPGSMLCIEILTHFPADDRVYFTDRSTYDVIKPKQKSLYSVEVSPYCLN